MKVRWTESAERQRFEIWGYIAADNPAAANRMDELFMDAAARLEQHPMMCRRGEMPGTREYIVHPSYRMVYRIVEDTLWIVTLIHTAREWPPAEMKPKHPL
jgi:addiction module RelE/StbE family toxin